MDIWSNISNIKGVGPKLAEKLNRCGIFTILDLLLYFPRDYEYVMGEPSFEEIDEEIKQILTCKAVSFGKEFMSKSRKYVSTINFEYEGRLIEATWFNQRYIKKNYRIGEEYSLLGKFKKKGDKLQVTTPIIACKEAKSNEIVPIYPLKGDLTIKILQKIISQVLDEIKISDNLTDKIIKKYRLVTLDEAIRNIHFPSGKETLRNAINRLKFQELFTYSMKLLLLKDKLKKNKGISFPWVDELGDLKASLPYKLTNAQTRAVRDILRDQKSEYSMNRLVQGDVGSGKTIVSIIAMFNVVKSGYQAALMVPTEILAIQHYEECKKMMNPFNIDIELLTGSTKAKEKARIKERIKSGEPIVVVGTHALIQEDVEFTNIGIVVTDEQHRFGVEQRSKLINKGIRPDVLVMTATPIPRTLALYMYSDLDVSIIDELPPGRKKIDTKFYSDKERKLAYSLAREQVIEGRQVYIVCPLIEENEKLDLNSVMELYEDLKEGAFKGINVEVLHGKMKPKEKEEIINRFKANETKVIISTTVIEVGVNVPNASVMIIENAERFGLAQLHQLRGRVGRGQYESFCILIANAKSDTTKRRMEIMTESTDGFYIAEEDLKIRGSGEMFGMKQSGEEGLMLANIFEDMNILKCARKEASDLLNSDNFEDKKIVHEVDMSLKRWSKYICFN